MENRRTSEKRMIIFHRVIRTIIRGSNDPQRNTDSGKITERGVQVTKINIVKR